MGGFHVDFLPRPPRARSVAALLFVAGVIVAGAGALWVQSLRDEQAAISAEVGRYDSTLRPRSRGAAPEATMTPERQREVAQANRIASRLNLPWSGLFDAVERSAGDTVVLLALQPDPVEGTVRLTGEAKTLPLVLGYLSVLQKQPVLAEVRLESHDTQVQDAQRPVRFIAAARWQVRP